MQMIYLAMKHPEHPFKRGVHLEAGTVEEAFDKRKSAADYVAEKNKKATYSHWSVKAKRVKSGTDDKAPNVEGKRPGAACGERSA